MLGDTALMQHARGVMGTVNGLTTASRPSIEESVRVSWQRCVNDYRLDPARPHSPSVLDHSGLKDLQIRHDELVDIARAEMDALYEQISGSGYALLLSDAQGIILCEKVDPALSRMFRSAGLILGADWSERHEGTNGVGTCIAEMRPVTVHRADHFRSRHTGLTCSGAPIRDVHGSLVAVLDASSVESHDTRASQMHTMALVNTSARLIEKCLFLRRCQGMRVLRFHSRPEFVNLLHDAALAIDDNGIISAADQMAVSLLNVAGRRDLVGTPLSELFDLPSATLDPSANNTRHALIAVRDLRLGRRYFASLHQPQRSRSLVSSTIIHTEAAPTPAPMSRSEMLRIEPCALPAVMQLEDLAGNDMQMQRNLRCARRLADSRVPILIQGPTGAGKEAFAKAFHLASNRSDRPFVAVNCAAIPESLIESELFGYRPGAFTGARKEGMRGRILQSSTGTLFLDEIGDMPLNLQTRLLRVLEEQEVVPLGGDTPIKVDLRVISASHRNLRDMIRRGEFREDLYYRLNGITLELSALRDRADRETLIRRFIAAEALSEQPVMIEQDAFNCLLEYPWPGNIRELRNVVRTALAICDDGIIRRCDLPSELRETQPLEPTLLAAMPQNSASVSAQSFTAAPAAAAAPNMPAAAPPAASSICNPLEAAERAAILQAVEHNRWNMTLTARQLGMSRNTLYRKLKRHDIPVGDARRYDPTLN